MIKVNAYRVIDRNIKFKEPLDISVIAAGDMFCIIEIEGREYAVKATEVAAAMQAACPE